MNLDQLEKVPTSVMKEIKVEQNITEDITANTAQAESIPFQQSANDDILNDFGKYSTQGNSQTQSQNLNAGSLLTADIAINFVDIIIPAVLVIVIKKGLGKTASKNSFSLTSTEKKTIEPVLQNYLNSINFRVESPLNALLLTLAMIYGIKVVEVINVIPNGKFNPEKSEALSIGQPTANGTMKRDGRGRPKGSFKNK